MYVCLYSLYTFSMKKTILYIYITYIQTDHMTHWANCTAQAGLLCHENSFVLLHVFHSYTKSLVDKVSCGETNPPLRIWIVLLVEGKKGYLPILEK